MASLARPGLLVLAALAAASPGAIPAQESDPDPLMTIEAQDRFRDRLRPHLLLVTVQPVPDPPLDPAFLPKKHGMAVRVALPERGRAVLTSAALVEGAGAIEVSSALEPERTVTASAEPTRGGLAEVRCARAPDDATPGRASPCDDGPPVEPALAGACDPDRVLYALVPAGARVFVVVRSVVADRGGVLPEDLALVQGRFPEGTPLFDASGRVAAVVVRPAADSSARSLAAPLAPPAIRPTGSDAPSGTGDGDAP